MRRFLYEQRHFFYGVIIGQLIFQGYSGNTWGYWLAGFATLLTVASIYWPTRDETEEVTR